MSLILPREMGPPKPPDDDGHKKAVNDAAANEVIDRVMTPTIDRFRN